MNTEAITRACEKVGGITALANQLGITVGAVHQWTVGIRPVPTKHCPKIEHLTDRAVKAEDLRPDFDWHLIRGKDAA